jgi:hypothetical protein
MNKIIKFLNNGLNLPVDCTYHYQNTDELLNGVEYYLNQLNKEIPNPKLKFLISDFTKLQFFFKKQKDIVFPNGIERQVFGMVQHLEFSDRLTIKSVIEKHLDISEIYFCSYQKPLILGFHLNLGWYTLEKLPNFNQGIDYWEMGNK